jgi:hypothetical protein
VGGVHRRFAENAETVPRSNQNGNDYFVAVPGQFRVSRYSGVTGIASYDLTSRTDPSSVSASAILRQLRDIG